ELRLLPVFDAQRHFLGVYASLFCFLLFAWCFYGRHWYGRLMLTMDSGTSGEDPDPTYPLKWIFMYLTPLFSIALSLFFVFLYQETIDQSILASNTKDALTVTVLGQIPLSSRLTMFYLGIFVFAELAFVSMAVKEYLLDLLHVSDEDLIIRAVRRD